MTGARSLSIVLLAGSIAAAACNADRTTKSNDDGGVIDDQGVKGVDGDTTRLDASVPAPDSGLTPPEKHRPAPVKCDNVRPSPPVGSSPQGTCSAHSDCTQGKNGRCSASRVGYTCTYDECFEDSDCGTGGVCQCEGGFRSDNNVCLKSVCQIDADCGPGSWCSPSFGDCGNYTGVTGYYCHTPKDECINDSDCVGQGPVGPGTPYCMYNEAAGYWQCSSSHCVG